MRVGGDEVREKDGGGRDEEVPEVAKEGVAEENEGDAQVEEEVTVMKRGHQMGDEAEAWAPGEEDNRESPQDDQVQQEKEADDKRAYPTASWRH